MLALGAFVSYMSWLGWDQEYQRDPVTGASSGPYEAWQVLGCAATLSVLAVVAGLLARPALAVAVIPTVFTLTWSVEASRRDDSGLWVVGAFMLACGSFGAMAALAYLAEAAGRRWIDNRGQPTER